MLLHVLQRKAISLFTENGSVTAALLFRAEISGTYCPSVTAPTENHAMPGSHVTVSPVQLTQHLILHSLVELIGFPRKERKGRKTLLGRVQLDYQEGITHSNGYSCIEECTSNVTLEPDLGRGVDATGLLSLLKAL